MIHTNRTYRMLNYFLNSFWIVNGLVFEEYSKTIVTVTSLVDRTCQPKLKNNNRSGLNLQIKKLRVHWKQRATSIEVEFWSTKIDQASTEVKIRSTEVDQIFKIKNWGFTGKLEQSRPELSFGRLKLIKPKT